MGNAMRKATLIHSLTEIPYLTDSAEQRLIPCRNLSHLKAALSSGIEELGQEIDRVLINEVDYRSFLHFLTDMPSEFCGDAMLIDNDGSAFMSSVGRGGDRVIYSLNPSDVHFYLMVHGLAAKHAGSEREVA